MPRRASPSKVRSAVTTCCVREVMKKERARHVVEGSILETRAFDVRTDEAEPVDRAGTPSVRERTRRHVERRHAQVETPSASPCDERAWHVGRTARHVEHRDPLTGCPRAAEAVELGERGPGAAQAAIHERQESVDLVDDHLLWFVVIQDLSLEASRGHPHVFTLAEESIYPLHTARSIVAALSARRPTATSSSVGTNARRRSSMRAARPSARGIPRSSLPNRSAVRPICNLVCS